MTNEELAERLQGAGEDTPEAADIMEKLWMCNQGLIKQTVHRVTGLSERDDGFSDFIQQAFFGLRAAAYAFDPTVGAAFSTYAVKRVEWELHRYFEQSGFAVRVPAFMKRRLRACMEAKHRLEAETGRAVTYADALKAMGLSSAVIASTLTAFRRLETVSLDVSRTDDNSSLLDLLADGSDMEESLLMQEWCRELRKILMAALRELPEPEQAVIIRRYFGGVSYSRQARESGVLPGTVRNRASSGYRSIRTGRYGHELATFMPDISSKARADRIIRQDRKNLERLNLSEDERGLLAL